MPSCALGTSQLQTPSGSRQSSENSSFPAHAPVAGEYPMDSCLEKAAEFIQINPNCELKPRSRVHLHRAGPVLLWACISPEYRWQENSFPYFAKSISHSPRGVGLSRHVSRVTSPQQHSWCFSLSFSMPSLIALDPPCTTAPHKLPRYHPLHQKALRPEWSAMLDKAQTEPNSSKPSSGALYSWIDTPVTDFFQPEVFPLMICPNGKTVFPPFKCKQDKKCLPGSKKHMEPLPKNMHVNNISFVWEDSAETSSDLPRIQTIARIWQRG